VATSLSAFGASLTRSGTGHARRPGGPAASFLNAIGGERTKGNGTHDFRPDDSMRLVSAMLGLATSLVAERSRSAGSKLNEAAEFRAFRADP
jgi:hypothetical protein